ncbi:hypothetical protein BHE74_00053536, partial [Ensete ventricosum]
RSPIVITTKLRIHQGSNTWYQSSILGVLLPFHSHPSAPQIRPKQFPQLLEDLTKFYGHLHYYRSSFDLPMNYNRFWFPALLLLQFSYPYSKIYIYINLFLFTA